MPGPDLTTGPLINSSTDAILADFNQETCNAKEIQAEVLHEILKRNANTEYLRRFGLEGHLGVDALSNLPLVTHSDLKPYFDRIADGDRSSILTTDPIHTLSLSSGTTSDGQQKYLLLYKEILDASLKLARISGAFRTKAFQIRSGKKVLDLVFSGQLSVSKGGLKLGTATTHLFRSEAFKLKYKSADVRTCSPQEVIHMAENRQAMYCHLLSALVFRDDIEFIHSTFAYTVIEGFKTLQKEWRTLCEDIRTGKLNAFVRAQEVRDAMADHVLVAPRPKLANAIANICGELDDDWSGAIPRIWPNCKYILSIMTGSMLPYLKKLQYYAGHLRLVTSDYGATETWVGVNTNPLTTPHETTFTIVPTFAYFEFLPLNNQPTDQQANEASQLVGIGDVEVGKVYEVVITTYGGLYRYRLGDVVQIAGFYNQCPMLSYICRKNVVLTIHIDKTTEKDLQIAVDKGLAKLQEHNPSVELIDFTSYANLTTTPGHYVIFLELNHIMHGNTLATHGVEDSILGLQHCANAIDLSFQDPGYFGSRKVHTIGPLELCILQPGTFHHLLNRYLTRGTAMTQYKTPRCVPSEELHNILRSNVSISTFSTAYCS